MASVLVVGAGMTGCATAAMLRQRLPDADITVWDKARGTGGRMSTSRSGTGDSKVDLGAQYFTLTQHYKDKRLPVYSELQSLGLLAPLKGTIEGPNRFDADGAQHFITPQGSASLVKHYLQQAKATVEFNHQVTSVEGGANGSGLTVTDNSGRSLGVNAVVLTMPVPQVMQLQGVVQTAVKEKDPDTWSKLGGVSYSSRFCLGLFYAPGTEIPYDWCAKYFDKHPSIRFVAIDTKKRGVDTSSVGPSIVVHTHVPFGLKHIEEDKEQVKDILMAHVKEALPDLPPPAEVKSQKWRYSQVHHSYPGQPGCLTIQQKPLVVVGGDAFTLSTFDGCLDSAEALAATVVDHFNTSNL